MIEIKSMSKKFTDLHALKDISMNITKGEMVAIMGPSGSGKTTLLNCMGGLEKPTSGEVMISNINVSNMTSEERQLFRREGIGYIFQDFRLLDQYCVIDNVMLPALPYSPINKVKERAELLLKKFHIEHCKNQLPNTISGGEKQRTAIARALINDPFILLCDEPTGNLDSENRDRIMNALSQLKREGKTIVIVTHDSDVAIRCDRQFNIRDGVLKEGIKV